MGSLLAHAKRLLLMGDALQQVGILLRDVLPNVQAIMHALVMKSFEYAEHVFFNINVLND